jgi:hypothetical protein
MRAHHDKQNESKTSGIGTVLLSVAVIALTGMVGTIGLIREVADIGPKVGDIVAFEPLDQATVACVLDVRAMHAGGGSVIIESRQPMTLYGMRVHWAGARTSNDGMNCGSSAELLLNQDDIEVLAMAAGGFGVPASKTLHLPFWNSDRAAQ